MTRERLVWLLTLAGLALGGWWLSVNTEWVDEYSPRAALGEARDNPVYAFEQLLRRLGMQAEHHEALDAMPPPHARLVLLSSDWQLMPGRGEQLQRWVLGGGHLVLPQYTGWDDTPLAKWVPVESVHVKTFKPAAEPRPAAPAASAVPAKARVVRTDLTSVPPLWGDTEVVDGCHFLRGEDSLRPKPGNDPAWTLTHVRAQPDRPVTHALRMPIGQGSVTVLNAGNYFFYNSATLACDNALVLAAALQAEPGATAWIYLDEKREPLLPWLWHRGWIAIVAGLLALAAALWRAAVRFGPLRAAAPRLRRSISEQVRGLGAYLQGGGREALLAAQQRALGDVAARKLRRYARLPANERVRAIAAATGLAADELSTAMSARFCSRAELPQRLQLLETARRRLHESPQGFSERKHSP